MRSYQERITTSSWFTHLTDRLIVSLITQHTVGEGLHFSAMTNSTTCRAKLFRLQRGRQVASDELKKSECGSSAQSCQANVIQTVNWAEVAVGKREIPHCITTLLSKLYYLGHCLVYACQSYHTETETVLFWLCSHPHINTHRRGYMLQIQLTHQQTMSRNKL